MEKQRKKYLNIRRIFFYNKNIRKDNDREKKQLHNKVGRLTVEADFLDKSTRKKFSSLGIQELRWNE